jgi:hypothetical protein
VQEVKPFRWHQVADCLAAEPPGTRLRVARHLAEHPGDAGLRPALGLPVGQRGDFRLARLVVQDFGSYYEAFLDAPSSGSPDEGSPAGARSPAGPRGTEAAGAGALLGLLLGRSREATLLGALFGLALIHHARGS